MKQYRWNDEKNRWLQHKRGISFEEIVFHIMQGDEVTTYDHPNQERYPGQKISVVLVNRYAYLVPFVESETELFLKTIIPSRRATKRFLGGNS